MVGKDIYPLREMGSLPSGRRSLLTQSTCTKAVETGVSACSNGMYRKMMYTTFLTIVCGCPERKVSCMKK